MLVSERITGKGAVQSLDLAVGVPLWEIEPFLGAAVIGLVYVGLRFPKEKEPMKVRRRATFALAAPTIVFHSRVALQWHCELGESDSMLLKLSSSCCVIYRACDDKHSHRACHRCLPRGAGRGRGRAGAQVQRELAQLHAAHGLPDACRHHRGGGRNWQGADAHTPAPRGSFLFSRFSTRSCCGSSMAAGKQQHRTLTSLQRRLLCRMPHRQCGV